MAKSNKVLFASSDVTVHRALGVVETPFGKTTTVESVVLLPGDTFPVDALPDYQLEAVENGEMEGVEVLTEKQAEEKKQELEKLRELVSGGTSTVYTAGLSGPDADDGSFSDHLLADAERVANHAARADEEADGEVSDDKVTVSGAESKSSPAQSGRKTKGAEVSEEVQGTDASDAADGSEE